MSSHKHVNIPSGLVPKGLIRITQRFNVGLGEGCDISPKGTAEIVHAPFQDVTLATDFADSQFIKGQQTGKMCCVEYPDCDLNLIQNG
jgi:hypothetical protein